jgi:hypothetical protein
MTGMGTPRDVCREGVHVSQNPEDLEVRNNILHSGNFILLMSELLSLFPRRRFVLAMELLDSSPVRTNTTRRGE